jgi:hypothetical protein
MVVGYIVVASSDFGDDSGTILEQLWESYSLLLPVLAFVVALARD